MKQYLSRTEVAERIGVTPGALSRYKLPDPDAMIGQARGWTEQTIDDWQAARPGRGARTDITRIPALASKDELIAAEIEQSERHPDLPADTLWTRAPQAVTRRKRYTPEQRQTAVDAYRAGASAIDAAGLVGATTATLYQWLGPGERHGNTNRKYTPEEQSAAIAAYVAGADLAHAAAPTGAAKKTVGQWLRAAGIPLRGAHVHNDVINDETRARAVALYRSGYTSAQVSRMTGDNAAVIRRWVIAAGLPTRASGRRRQQPQDDE